METLKEIIKQKALKFGNFTLASGKKSTFYLDCKNVTLDPVAMPLIGNAILQIIRGAFPTTKAVGGMSIGADPITSAVVMSSLPSVVPAVMGTTPEALVNALYGFMIRKEAKDHGMGGRIVGPVWPGWDAVIVEDVCTTGGSSWAAAEAAMEFGLKVQGVITIIDRMQGGSQFLGDRGLPLYALFNLEDLGIDQPSSMVC
jgi:orotate phosphoribosyltransferase